MNEKEYAVLGKSFVQHPNVIKVVALLIRDTTLEYVKSGKYHDDMNYFERMERALSEYHSGYKQLEAKYGEEGIADDDKVFESYLKLEQDAIKKLIIAYWEYITEDIDWFADMIERRLDALEIKNNKRARS